MKIKEKIYEFLRWLERYTGTDMVYLAKSGSWLISGSIVSTLAGLGIMVAFDHLVSKEVFGIYQYILSIAGILAIFSLPGIDAALIRTVAKGNEKMIIPCFKEKVKWGAIGGLISLFIAFWYLFQQNFELGFSFLIVALFLPLINSFLVYLSFWQGKKRFDIQNKYYIFYNIIVAFLLVLIIILTKNLILIILCHFLALALAGAIFYKLTIKKISNGEPRTTTSCIRSKEKETISFGKHLTLMQTIATFSTYIDKIILWKLLGPISVAVYAFAERPVLKFQEIIPIHALALPKLSQSNIKEIKKELLKKFLKLFLVAALATLVYILLCPYLYKIFFPAYMDSIQYSQFLALILIFSPFLLLSTSFLAEMRKKELYILNLTTPILKIVLLLIFIPLFGIWGIIYSVLISQTFNGILTLYFFKKI